MKTRIELLQLLNYSPTTGILTWKQGRRKGKQAGSVNKHGYREISFSGCRMKAHRVAWIITHGDVLIKGDRSRQIDHINQDKDDNRLINLRLTTPSINCHNRPMMSNNTSGVTGVNKHRVNGSDYWEVRCMVNGKRKSIGAFMDFDEAVAARLDYAS